MAAGGGGSVPEAGILGAGVDSASVGGDMFIDFITTFEMNNLLDAEVFEEGVDGFVTWYQTRRTPAERAAVVVRLQNEAIPYMSPEATTVLSGLLTTLNE